VKRFVDRSFTETYTYTSSSAIHTVNIPIEKANLIIHTYDLSSTEDEATDTHFRSAQAAFLVFDLTDVNSFNEIDRWVSKAKAINSRLIFALVGNKSDLVTDRKISKEQMEEKAKKIGIDKSFIFECSAKTNSPPRLEKSMASVCKKITELKLNDEYQLKAPKQEPRSIPVSNNNPFSLLKKPKKTIILSMTTLALAGIVITASVLLWPLILALPFLVAAGSAIASLGIGITASTASTALAIAGLSLMGAAIVTTGTWLTAKLFSSKSSNCFPTLSHGPDNNNPSSGPGSPSTIYRGIGASPSSQPISANQTHGAPQTKETVTPDVDEEKIDASHNHLPARQHTMPQATF
jgi:GTPase SAR1 family protein